MQTRKKGKGQVLAQLSNVEFLHGIKGESSYVQNILHVWDGWVVIYTIEYNDPKMTVYKQQRTCYVQASDGMIKWDMINASQ